MVERERPAESREAGRVLEEWTSMKGVWESMRYEDGVDVYADDYIYSTEIIISQECTVLLLLLLISK